MKRLALVAVVLVAACSTKETPKADTAAPVILAWGSPGAPLVEYGNAVVGRTLPTSSPAPAGSASATANPSTTPNASTSTGGTTRSQPSGSAAPSTAKGR